MNNHEFGGTRERSGQGLFTKMKKLGGGGFSNGIIWNNCFWDNWLR